MPVSVLGWWRTGLPSRPAQDRRRASGGARKLAAPPAGVANSHPADPPPPTPERSPEEEGSDAQEPGTGHALEKAAAPEAGRALGVAAVLSGARNWGFLLHAVGVHTANLAASLATRPLAPLQARLQAQLAGTEAVQAACRQLGVDSLSELQDLMNCVLLSEHVYKIVDHTTDVSVTLINKVKAQFPPHLTTLRTVQWAQSHVRHRYLLGESDDAVYVSFMGTKLPRDMATNANLFQEEVVLDAAMLSSGPSAEVGEGSAGAGVAGGRTLAAHRGFLLRARSIPVQQLYQEAQARGKRLVLCGHSLGGAVASLCAIRLLQHLPPNLHHTVSVFGFATPALGNDALQAAVQEMGWHSRIRNYISPDDPIPKLLSFRRPPAERAAGKASAADGSNRSNSATAEATSEAGAHQAGAHQAGHAPAAAPATAAVPSIAGATPAAAAVLSGANNIQSAPRLSAGLAVSGAQQRLGRIASHVAAGSRQAEAGLEAAEQPQNKVLLQAPMPGTHSGNDLPRSRSAPAQLSDAAVAAVEEHTAAVAAANGATSEAQSDANGSGEGRHSAHSGPQHWLGQRLAEAAAPPLRRAGSAALAAAAPPMRAVVERAGSAARLVALPLSAAASVPMRAAPSYLPLGRQLYILPAAVSSTEPPPGQAAAAPAAAPALPPRRWPALWRPQPAAAAVGGGSQDEDVEDNVDVAAAASLSASLDGEEASAAAAAQQQRRKGMFHSHRMATYRSRLLAICQGALEGHLMVRSLPMLPTLPRPGDVVASELLAPPMFPLRAVATLDAPEAAAVAAHGARRGAAPAPAQGHVQAAAAQAPAPPAHQQQPGQAQGQPAGRRGFRPLAFWGRLLARAASEQRRRQEAPLELLIRVEGRGLANVTAAWIEGIPPAAPAEAAQAAATGSRDGGDAAAAPGQALPAATVAEVQIVEKPAAQALLPPLQGRPPLPVVGQLSAFVSWVAATLGWVALLRQLQPAGRSDYLLARVCLPAAAVRDAQRMAENSLLTSVTDGPLLQGLHIGPRLSLRLQSDFASHSVPLDIRVGADLSAQQAQRWQWPWRRPRGGPLATPSKVHPMQQQRMRQRGRKPARPQQQQQGRLWWEWPGGTAASGQQ